MSSYGKAYGPANSHTLSQLKNAKRIPPLDAHTS